MTPAEAAPYAIVAGSAAAIGAMAEGAVSVPLGIAITAGIAIAGAAWAMVKAVASLTESATEIRVVVQQHIVPQVDDLREDVKVTRVELAEIRERLARTEGRAAE